VLLLHEIATDKFFLRKEVLSEVEEVVVEFYSTNILSVSSAQLIEGGLANRITILIRLKRSGIGCVVD